MAEDYRGLTRRASETMPRVLFVLIPALAAVLACSIAADTTRSICTSRCTSARSSLSC